MLEGKDLAKTFGVEDYLEWPYRPMGEAVTNLYQKSLFCIIPFTKGSACYPVTTAMANGTPVIATREAGVPEYLRDLGIYVEKNSPDQLAQSMIKVMDEPSILTEYGPKMTEQAMKLYSWNVVADATIKLYRTL
jgi:glycosyltransferase involved in cell wall biosynthesis